METGDDRPVSNIAASSMLTAEITLISSLLIAVVMLRLLNRTLNVRIGGSHLCISICCNAHHAAT